MDLDVVIKNGDLVDGSGGPRTRQDVGIAGGRVTAVGAMRQITMTARFRF